MNDKEIYLKNDRGTQLVNPDFIYKKHTLNEA
jgi:hypothetical protein